ncbi:multidrug and toxin extrusion protein 2 isoform X2 [Sus scrofa]|uniref:multidrug and toxin extrusion protein 2 isoform X2 n=1 Tax=Sus scrofa TaxID=9823 RepID=UPI000A2B0901|nr:multidrug and toxin extrusion protein 2 isoform X2 [Sus scrofa]
MDGLQDTVPPGRGSRCPALRRLVPVGFGAEARILFVLSGPLFLFQMLNFLIYVVSSVFCGHLGKVELAAVTLSVAFVNVCGVSIGFGLSSACDTLMSQSFGSPNKKHVGVILQRGALVLLLCCLPCWALFLNTEHILLLFRQDPAVSRLAQDYVQIFIPALPANFLYCLLAKYLQNQGVVWPQVLSGIVGNCVNGLANYILVSTLGQGVRGSAYANTISQLMQTLFLLLYIVLRKLHVDTWGGWSCQCLQDWGPFFSLAVPSMLMTCIEWWAYEIGSFLMGLLSVLDLSAQAIIYEVATVTYMIPMGLSIAVCVRVGTALGAADTVQAKRSAVSGMLCTVGAAMVVGALLSILRNKLGHIFTHDEEVVALVNKALPLYIVFHLFEATCVSPTVTHTCSPPGPLPEAVQGHTEGATTGMCLRRGPPRNRQAGFRGHCQRHHVLRRRPPAGHRADLCGQDGHSGPLAGHAGLRPAGRCRLCHLHGADGLEAGCRGGSEKRGAAAEEHREHGPQARARESGHVFSGHRQPSWRDPDDILQARVPPGPLGDSRGSAGSAGSFQQTVSHAAGPAPRGCPGGGGSHAAGRAAHQGPDSQALARQLDTGRRRGQAPTHQSTDGTRERGAPGATPKTRPPCRDASGTGTRLRGRSPGPLTRTALQTTPAS